MSLCSLRVLRVFSSQMRKPSSFRYIMKARTSSFVCASIIAGGLLTPARMQYTGLPRLSSPW